MTHRLVCPEQPSLTIAARLAEAVRKFESRHNVRVSFESRAAKCADETPFALIVRDEEESLTLDDLEVLRRVVLTAGLACSEVQRTGARSGSRFGGTFARLGWHAAHLEDGARP